MSKSISPGMWVRYGGTGTSGTVTRIVEISRDRYAEIDTTGLLYQINQLTETGAGEKKEVEATSSDIILEHDIFKGNEFQESLNLDNSCEGGG